MNKKIINLGILLVFIFSCNVNTSNNNVEVKPTISVSSTTSVLPTVTSSVQINTSATSFPTQSHSVSPTIDITTNPIPTSLSYDFSKISYYDPITLNKERDGIENGYDGKVLIIVDTYLLKEYIESEEELNRMKRKVMILKDSYDELSEYEKEQLKQEYGDYTIFDRDTYIPITESKKYTPYEGELSIGSIGVKFSYFNDSRSVPVYRGMYVYKKNKNDYSIYSFELQDSFSYHIKYLHKNIKLSNKRKIMKAPIQKIVFGSISALSYYSSAMFYAINSFDDLDSINFYDYSKPLNEKSYEWRID